MKKSHFLVPLIASTAAMSLTPLTILSGCGAKYNENTNEIYEQSVDLFMGTEEQPGVCSVPHASYHLVQIRDLITTIVNNAGYEVKRDWYGNIWWDIPASEGCENWKPLVLQAHMDMVWTEAKTFNNEIKAPKPVIDTIDGEKVIHTENFASSLGADNGAGVATILALTLNKNVKHGKLRFIVTADEEPGMVGASYIGYKHEPSSETDVREINVVDHSEGWDYMLNIDGENEQEIYVSCAGGYSYEYKVDKFVTESFPDGAYCWKLVVDGCQGGHSGLAVANNHCNAIKVAVDIMGYINNFLENKHMDHARLSSINSFENATNVVPNKTEIVFASGLDHSWLDPINNYLKSVIYAYKQIYPAETGLDIRVEKVSTPPRKVIQTDEDSDIVLNFIDYFIYGVVSRDANNRVIASSNICPVTLNLENDGSLDKEQFVAKIYSRSEDRSLLSSFKDIAVTNFALLEGKIEHDGTEATDTKISEYAPWDYKEKDNVRDLAIKSFKKVGLKPAESRIHGGVECSWWYLLNPQIQQTAIGPTIDDVHDPKEKLHLDSYKKYISIILDVIAGMKNI